MIIHYAYRAVEWLLIALLALMMVLVFGNVVLRYGFNSGIVYAEELSRFSFMWLTMLGAVVAMRDGGHLGMTSLVDNLPVAAQRLCKFLSDLLMLGCCMLLSHGTWKFARLAMDDHAPVSNIPMGVVFSALLVCSASISLMLVASLWRQLTGKASQQASRHVIPAD